MKIMLCLTLCLLVLVDVHLVHSKETRGSGCPDGIAEKQIWENKGKCEICMCEKGDTYKCHACGPAPAGHEQDFTKDFPECCPTLIPITMMIEQPQMAEDGEK